MNLADALPWGTTVALMFFAFVWGECRRSEREDWRYDRLVGDDARQRAAIREIYDGLGWPAPDMWDGWEPEPTRWERVILWLRGGAEVESVPKVAVKPEPVIEPPVPDLPEELLEPTGIAPAQSGDVLDDLWWRRERSREESPSTEPIPVQPGPATVPQPAIGSRVEDLGLARALADIEDRIRRWQETRV